MPIKMENRVLEMQPLVSIIVVNYNGVSYLGNLFIMFLESLKKQTYKNIEIIMVDNASKDDSIEIAKGIIPSIKLIQLNENVGYARAVNIGVLKSSGLILIVCNNDIIFLDEGFIEKAVAKLLSAKEKYGNGNVILCPLQIVGEGNRILGTKPIINLLGQALHLDYRKPEEYFIRIKERLTNEWYGAYPDGACFIIGRDTISKLGFLLNPFIFMYFDDVDLGIRLSLIGGKTLFTKDLIIYHRLAETSGRALRLDKFVHFNVNRLMTFFSLLKPFQFLLLLPLLIIFDIGQLYFMCLYLRERRKDYIIDVILRYLTILWSIMPKLRIARSYYNSLKGPNRVTESIFSEYLLLPAWFYKKIFESRIKFLFLTFLHMLNAFARVARLRPIKKIVCIDTLV